MMKLRLVIVTVIAMPLIAVAAAPWHTPYDAALEAIDSGRPAEAVRLLEEAVALRPEPGLRLHTYGMRYVDYLPYLHLAVAAQMLGDRAAGQEYLATSEHYGVAERSEAGRELLKAYRVLLKQPESPPVEPRSDDVTPPYAHYERQPEVLSEAEFEELARRLAIRCGVDSTPGAIDSAPWYYHYELGLALADRGDPQRALDALIAAADHRPDPQHTARMYGMWFTDYVPYFQIARAHAELGNWRCVLEALEVSQSSGEISERDAEFAAFRQLLAAAEQRAGDP